MYIKRVYFFSIVTLTLIHSSTSRKYDINQESVKLFGENIHTVLRRFRRTPDYLKILTGKKNALGSNVIRSSMLLLHHNAEDLKRQVIEALGVITKGSTAPDVATSKLLNVFEKLLLRRQNEEQQENTTAEEENAGVKILDTYSKLTSPLTVSEKNGLKDIGFQIAGTLIHQVIEILEPDNNFKSTLGPIDATSTTHVHEVTNTETPPRSFEEDRLRMRAKEKSNFVD